VMFDGVLSIVHFGRVLWRSSRQWLRIPIPCWNSTILWEVCLASRSLPLMHFTLILLCYSYSWAHGYSYMYLTEFYVVIDNFLLFFSFSFCRNKAIMLFCLMQKVHFMPLRWSQFDTTVDFSISSFLQCVFSSSIQCCLMFIFIIAIVGT